MPHLDFERVFKGKRGPSALAIDIESRGFAERTANEGKHGELRGNVQHNQIDATGRESDTDGRIFTLSIVTLAHGALNAKSRQTARAA